MNKATLSSHITALSAIFILGSGVISLPLKGADEFNFSAFIVSAVLLFVLYPLISFTLNKINCFAVVLAVMIFALFCGAEGFLEITRFVSEIILPDIPKFFICLIFGVTVIYFSLKQKEGILKFSLVSMVITGAVILFFFIAPMDKYDLRNIFVFRLPELREITTQIKPYIKLALQSIILPIYFKLTLGNTKTKQGFMGVLIGSLLLGFCILSPILLFGAQISGELQFPFSSAVSTVTVGRLFTRLDGFAYFIYFVSSLIKITVCLKVATEGLNKMGKRGKQIDGF